MFVLLMSIILVFIPFIVVFSLLPNMYLAVNIENGYLDKSSIELDILFSKKINNVF